MSVNPDLADERKAPGFEAEQLSTFLFGQSLLNVKRKIQKIIDSIPELQDPMPTAFMTREEQYENAARRTLAMVKASERVDISNYEETMLLRAMAMGLETSPLELHFVMFIPTLLGQGTPEQQEKWLPLAYSFSVIGTYAQTELGHGTNLKKLETTATYDASTNTFVLNSPTLTSTKWWCGNMGKTANYAVVQAQLWTKGQCHGPHLFIVKLRDLETHLPLPGLQTRTFVAILSAPVVGIEVGDIGPKLGYNSNDNGFLRFDKVRIPRDHMLMRHSKVGPDGTYFPAAHEKLSYGTMLFVRAVLVRNLAAALARCVTIAVRYSCVRRQGELMPGQGEVKVLDYQTQQYKLFPYIASTYAFFFAGASVWETYKRLVGSSDVDDADNNNNNNSNNASDMISLLPEFHALSAGLKAFVTWEATRGMEVARLACGGHGYSLASNLPQLCNYFAATLTYEGENTVLLLQVARSLVKSYRNLSANRNAAPSSSSTGYLRNADAFCSQLTQNLEFSCLLDLYQHYARRKIRYCVALLDQLCARGHSEAEAWDRCSVELTRAAKAHVHQFIVGNFIARTEECRDASIQEIVCHLCRLYCLVGIDRRPHKFTENGYLSAQQLSLVRDGVFALLKKIRTHAVKIVDAFQFSDRELNSVLGRFDGRVYEHLFEWAKSSPFNRTEVLACHQDYVGKIIKMSGLSSKL